MNSIRHIQPTTPRLLLAASLLAILSFTACQRRPATEDLPVKPAVPSAETTTLETGRLGTAIDTFAGAPTMENRSAVDLAFSKLDGEIAELESRVSKTSGRDRAEASAKLDSLKRYRADEMARMVKIQPGTAYDSPPADSRSGAQKLEDTAEQVGDKIEEGAEKVGDSIENAAHKTGEAIKDATQ